MATGLNAKNATSVTSVWLQARPQYRLALVLSAHHKLSSDFSCPPGPSGKEGKRLYSSFVLPSCSSLSANIVSNQSQNLQLYRTFAGASYRSWSALGAKMSQPCGSQTDNFLATGVFKVQCHLGGVIIRLRYPYSSCRLLVCFCGYGFPVISL